MYQGGEDDDRVKAGQPTPRREFSKGKKSAQPTPLATLGAGVLHAEHCPKNMNFT